MKSAIRDVIFEYIMSINGFTSGNEIAEIAHCSPQNVSYHIERLRGEGVDIEVSHKGYRYMRESDIGLANLKESFKKAGMIFEHIKSCLEIVSLCSARGDKKGIFYTFNEAAFFSGSSAGNLSFSVNVQKEFSVKSYIADFLNSYIDGDVLIEDVSNYIVWGDCIIGRYSIKNNVENFQLIVNNKVTRRVGEMEIRAISDIFGDHIGIKGFTVLIFENLYGRLTP